MGKCLFSGNLPQSRQIPPGSPAILSAIHARVGELSGRKIQSLGVQSWSPFVKLNLANLANLDGNLPKW